MVEHGSLGGSRHEPTDRWADGGKDPAQDFVALDNEMKALHDAGFFKGGKTTMMRPELSVSPSIWTARQRRFSSRSVAIAEHGGVDQRLGGGNV